MLTVEQFQKINEINSTTPDTVERLGWMVCLVFDFPEDEVNLMSAARFGRYVARINRRLSEKPRINRRVSLQTNAQKITLGQFIEAQYWLKDCTQPGDEIGVMDMVAATLLRDRGEGFDHVAATAQMRKRHFADVLRKVQAFIESQNELLRNYAGLFASDQMPEDADLEEVKREQKAKEHPFITQYGWQYSAKCVAEHLGITLNEAYDVGVLEAFNTLAYFKAKEQYDKIKNK